MQLHTVKTYLEITIKNKKELLETIQYTPHLKLVSEFLKINIQELERILKDIEDCISCQNS